MSHTLALARRDLGLSDSELARMIGVSEGSAYRTFYGWTKGIRNIDAGRERLLQAYLEGYRPKDWPKNGEAPQDDAS